MFYGDNKLGYPVGASKIRTVWVFLVMYFFMMNTNLSFCYVFEYVYRHLIIRNGKPTNCLTKNELLILLWDWIHAHRVLTTAKDIHHMVFNVYWLKSMDIFKSINHTRTIKIVVYKDRHDWSHFPK